MIATVAITEKGFTPYGGARDAFYDRSPEVVLSGPYDTGKTITMLHKINLLMCLFPGARGLMVRKTYNSLINSAVVTFEKKIHNDQIGTGQYPITKYGGDKPNWYDYPNGSRLVLGGLDNPGKTLSAEYDFIYVNQAEELVEDEWQALTRAASGRAGNTPYTQVMGDCNPDVPDHFIQKRKRLHLHESRHEENPTIFDPITGECIAPQRMAALDAMTGVRYKRGRLGLWVGREGQVYEFDPAVHLINRDQCPPFVRYYRAIDFGYTNPFVCQWWGEDSDGRIYLVKEIYMSRRTVNQHAPAIKQHSEGLTVSSSVADHDAEDRATLNESNIITIAADKRITLGIQRVEERLKVAGDGRPRLYIVRDALIEFDTVMEDERRPTCTREEFSGYVWPTRRVNRAADERPIKADDHGMDAMRYMVMHLDAPEDSAPGSSRYA